MWKNGYAILPVYSIMNSISCPGDRQRQRYKVFLREGAQMNEQFIQGIIFDWNFDGIEAYARALPRGTTFPTVSIGRVIAVKRWCGLGSKIVDSAIDVAREKLHTGPITIEAQVYARSLYEKQGFRQMPFSRNRCKSNVSVKTIRNEILS